MSDSRKFNVPVVLPGDPSQDLEATPKQYVDDGLATKAPLNSPALTGSPTAPTPAVNDNSERLATTEFVHDVVDGIVSSGGGFTWNTVTNVDVNPAVTNNGYLMVVTGARRDVVLPANIPTGFYLVIKADGPGGVRLVMNGNVLEEAGAGNNVLLADGNTLSVLGKAPGVLRILNGAYSLPGAAVTPSPRWEIVTSAQELVPNKSYLADCSGGTFDLSLPSPLTPGDRFIVASAGNPVRITHNGNTFAGAGANTNILVDVGLKAELVVLTSNSLVVVD